ncbi:hypothetical protein ACP4OV_000031 [Aristida adscensionis]
MDTEAAAADCEIARLPEDLLSEIVARTSPLDACRAAAVSPALRAAADSDAVWSRFLPRSLPPLAGAPAPAPPSRKDLFLCLSDTPALLDGRLTSMWVDRESGAKCYVLSARSLHIARGDTPQHWRWIPLADCSFSEAASLRAVCWLEIRGKIHSNMLSKNSTYAAYLVFKIADRSYGLDSPAQEATVSIGERESMRQVCVHDGEDDGDEETVNHLPSTMTGTRRAVSSRNRPVLPQRRADDWMELEMGDFYNEKGDDGEVCVSLMETKGGNWKKGLIVQGIEIRVKK